VRAFGGVDVTGSARGVSNVLGIVLLFAIVIGSAAVVVSVGGQALDETRGQLDVSRAEKAITQFDSRSAMVALGGTNSQGIDLATGAESGYSVSDSEGWMNVTIVKSAGGTPQTVVNTSLGAVVYRNGDQAIAYQGGGVWKDTASGAVMLSPPEFHFRSATLTLPIITVDGQPSLGSSATVRKGGPMTIEYPNATEDPDYVNPLENGRVNVTVQSEYYRAWGRYFEQRTAGQVRYNHTAGTVRTELVVPFREDFNDVAATTAPGGITVNGNDPQPSPAETGVNYPLPDSRVEERIEECEQNPSACDTSTTPTGITTDGTYYVDGDYSGGLDVDTNDGNVTIVVNGDFQPTSAAIDGPNSTQVLVREDVDISDDIEGGYSPGQLSLVVHSDGEFDMNGNSKLEGFVYAPGSECDLNGNAYIVGGIVCETMDINGNPNDFTYDSSVEDVDLQLKTGVPKLTYLHVTVNPVNVTSR
jgi:cytoskeletal protein CcmA (bactofilin family)